MKRFLLFLTALVAIARPAHAETVWFAGAETGFEAFDSDGYVSLAAWAGLDSERVRGALWAPLRLRVLDGGPASAGGAPALRREDWDEWSDRLRVLRYLDYRGGGLRVHVGELTGVTIGNGTIVDRFYNDLDFDTHHTGVHFSFDNGWWGSEWMADDVLRPRVVALRLFGRRKGWTLGLSGAVDAQSGYVPLAFDCDTSVRTRPCTGDESGVVITPREKAVPSQLLMLGLDLGKSLWRRGNAQVEAYSDLNMNADKVAFQGGVVPGVGGFMGLHLGVRGGPDETLQGRLEVVVAADRYAPGVIDPLYSAERQQIHLRTNGALGGKASVDVKVSSARVSVVADWRPGDGAGLFAWITLQPTDSFLLRGFYGQRHLDSLQAFTRGEGPVWHAAARLAVQGPWFAALTAGRFWHTRDGQQRLDLDVVATVGAELGR